jgi:hypothetical protein
MKNVQSYRTLGSICRQRAALDPENSWKHLGEAERWEQLAEAEIASHFKECNMGCSSDPAKSDANDTRWKTITAA